MSPFGTMVDRIVPAMTPEQFDMIKDQIGFADPCGIVCEDFRQWVIEDNFVAGRPDWDKAGRCSSRTCFPMKK